MIELKVGDVTDFRGEIEAIEESGRIMVFNSGQRVTRAKFFGLHPAITGKVHRQVGEDWVQVWPVVTE